nr:MAG TPA: hypothetical protein [Caudoviricetes sp.]
MTYRYSRVWQPLFLLWRREMQRKFGYGRKDLQRKPFLLCKNRKIGYT